MGFCRPPHPTHRLNYVALDAALHDKAKTKSKDPHIVQLQNCAQAYRKGDDIALKLYNTEIIMFHPDGEATIDCRGWIDKVATRWWLSEAHFNVYSHKINEWSDRVYLLNTANGPTQYYDGIRLQYDGIRLDSTRLRTEVKPMTMRVPNAEAVALLRKWRKVIREQYQSYIHMEEGGSSGVGQSYNPLRHGDAVVMLEKGEFEFELFRAALYDKDGKPGTKVANYVRRLWADHVRDHKMFDVQPYEALTRRY